MTTLHGRSVVVNYGYPYLSNAREIKTFNDPLVELAFKTWREKGRAIKYVDVGAAIGDTVLLLEANLGAGIAEYICVEGDGKFSKLLECNVRHLQRVRLIESVVSSSDEDVAGLVRTHAGTASAQGEGQVKSNRLSALIKDKVDMIKIDVDGFDGRVLSGAGELLRNSCPTVIFEWHPILCQKTKSNWLEHFAVLKSHGYTKFVWFNKYGVFSHFSINPNDQDLIFLGGYCTADPKVDWHYDVIALHESCTIDPLELAQLQFAKQRSSHY